MSSEKRPGRKERIEELQRIKDGWYREKDLTLLDRDDSRWVSHSHPLYVELGCPPTSAGRKKFMMMFLDAFPDIHQAIDDIIDDGDKSIVRWTITGTHTETFRSPLFTVPATNRRVTFTGINFSRYEKGKSGGEADSPVERWEQWDVFGLMTQLGIVPQPPYRSPVVEPGA